MVRGGLHRVAASLIILASMAGFLMLLFTEDLAASGSSLSDLSSSGDFLEQGDTQSRVDLDRLRFRIEDDPVAIPNHGVVPLEDGYQVEVAISPYPPTRLDLNIDLFLTTDAGTPVAGAIAGAVWDMTIMAHGPFTTDLTGTGDGHYVAPFDLFMVGPWELNVTIEIPDTQTEQHITLYVYVWPE